MTTANHFTLLLYNFRHTFSGAGREASLSALSGRWRHWWLRLDEAGQLETALDDIYFYLPHVQRVLFAESLPLPSGNDPTRLEAARQLSSLSLDAIGRNVSSEAMLRLTLERDRLEEIQDMALDYERSNGGGRVVERFSCPFKMLWVDVALFPFQIGFLILKVLMKEPSPPVARINDFHYYARTIHPPKLGWVLATWRITRGEPIVSCNARDLVEYLLQGLTEQASPPSPSLKAAVDEFGRVGEAGRYTGTPFGQVYGQTFNAYHYACLAGSGPPDGPSPPFDSAAERVLYELATCTDSQDSTYRPDALHVRRLMNRHRIALWESWQGLALHDNVAFLGLSEGPFTCRDLAHNVENDYFYLYLLSLFCKSRLNVLSGEMMGREGRLGHSLRRARRLWKDFREFQDDYWFGEVTRKVQGHEIHRHFREGLGIGPIYDELRDKVREHQEYYELQLERRVGDLLMILTFIWVPAGAVCSLFGSALGFHSSWFGFVSALVTAWLVAGTSFAWVRRDELRESRTDLRNRILPWLTFVKEGILPRLMFVKKKADATAARSPTDRGLNDG